MHPTQIEQAVDLANQMIRRHHLIQIKGIKELALSVFPSTHHVPSPMMPASTERNHCSSINSIGVLQHNRSNSGHQSVCVILVNAIPVLKGAGNEPKTPAIAMICICIWCGQKKWDSYAISASWTKVRAKRNL